MRRKWLAAFLCVAWCLAGQEQCPKEDQDGDGYTVDGGDCDDWTDTTYPGATELCDGMDNDCDGAIERCGWSSAVWGSSVW